MQPFWSVTKMSDKRVLVLAITLLSMSKTLLATTTTVGDTSQSTLTTGITVTRATSATDSLLSSPASDPAKLNRASLGDRGKLNEDDDLMTAAGEHGKYMFVKKKPKKAKKVKMEYLEPKIKYKKIKVSVPVKKMKKKKVKGYMVKKKHHH